MDRSKRPEEGRRLVFTIFSGSLYLYIKTEISCGKCETYTFSYLYVYSECETYIDNFVYLPFVETITNRRLGKIITQ
jgi:hypothetical protein